MAFEWLSGLTNALGSEGFKNFASDPNVIRTMGDVGAALSGPDSIGAAVGTGASNLVRNRQLQQAAGQQMQNAQSMQNNLLNMLTQGNLLSPTNQNNAFDKFTIDGDGNIGLSMKNTPQQTSFLGEQKPLESRMPQTPQAYWEDFLYNGGTSPNFPNGQSSVPINLAGLNPEDIANIVQSDIHYRDIYRKNLSDYLAQKQARDALLSNILEGRKKSLEERAFKTSEREAGETFRKGFEQEKADRDLKNAITLAKVKAKIEPTKFQSDLLELQKKRIQFNELKNEQDRAIGAAELESEIVQGQTEDKESVIPLMDYINTTFDRPYYYMFDPSLWYSFGSGDNYKLPLESKSGVKFTMEDARNSARAAGMTVEDFLSSPGIGVLIKEGKNDYRPANR